VAGQVNVALTAICIALFTTAATIIRSSSTGTARGGRSRSGSAHGKAK
jgi:hypothetical protein